MATFSPIFSPTTNPARVEHYRSPVSPQRRFWRNGVDAGVADIGFSPTETFGSLRSKVLRVDFRLAATRWDDRYRRSAEAHGCAGGLPLMPPFATFAAALRIDYRDPFCTILRSHFRRFGGKAAAAFLSFKGKPVPPVSIQTLLRIPADEYTAWDIPARGRKEAVRSHS